jgi:DNA-binding GntR family transcriptional regulator
MDGPQESAEQTAYKSLRERIVSGRLPGGSPLRQERLAAEFGLSRIPVRDAIRHLVASGLVTFESNRRAVVTLLDECDLSELFAMRSVLEGLAARHAVPNLSERDIERLVWLANQMDQTERNVDLWMPIHVEFHELICDRSNMPRLCTEITRLRQRVEPYVRVMISLRGVAELRLSRHNSIIKAIRGQDPDCAERTLREHVMQASREIRYSVRSSQLNVPLATTHRANSERAAVVVQRPLRRRAGTKE